MDPRTDLLPVEACPFCGCEQVQFYEERGHKNDGWWLARCASCDVTSTGHFTKEAAIAAWNTRAHCTPETQIGRDGLVEEWNTLMDSTSMLSFNTEVAAWARKNVPALLAADHPNVLDEVERVANVKRELAERARNMMGLLADLRASVDLDDDSSEGVLGYCDDLETAVHNIAAVASHLPGAAIPADPLRARLVEALGEARFLTERLGEFEAVLEDGISFSEFHGHVTPSLARLCALLAELTPESQ